MSETLSLVIAALEGASGAKAPEHVFTDLKAGKDVAFDALDMDSLSRFEVIMRIEEELDIELDEDEVLAQQTVFAFVDFVSKRAAGA